MASVVPASMETLSAEPAVSKHVRSFCVRNVDTSSLRTPPLNVMSNSR